MSGYFDLWLPVQNSQYLPINAYVRKITRQRRNENGPNLIFHEM